MLVRDETFEVVLDARQELRGERTGIRYSVGTRVHVQVSRVDLDGRKIDFRLIRDGDDLPVRALKDKGVSSRDGGSRALGDAGAGGAPQKKAARKSGAPREHKAASSGQPRKQAGHGATAQKGRKRR